MSLNNVKKSIGWADWTINPVKGLCPVGCSYCYARRAYGRNCNETFKDKSIRYDSSVFIDTYKAKPGSRIFVGSTIDLFHPLCSAWNDEIISICRRNDDLTFIFLTKCPENLPHEWPDNCWVGVSATDERSYAQRMAHLIGVDARVKFISFEPLQGKIDGMLLRNTLPAVNQVIIGAQTPYSIKTAPKIEWIKEIVDAADKAKIPVFLKSNLEALLRTPKNDYQIDTGLCTNFGHSLRQEIPEVK